jgi:hypothetical protein
MRFKVRIQVKPSVQAYASGVTYVHNGLLEGLVK